MMVPSLASLFLPVFLSSIDDFLDSLGDTKKFLPNITFKSLFIDDFEQYLICNNVPVIWDLFIYHYLILDLLTRLSYINVSGCFT